MTDRITINSLTFMNLDGQPQLVYPGTVVDVPAAGVFAPSTVTTVRTGTGTLASHGKPTPVSVRKGPG